MVLTSPPSSQLAADHERLVPEQGPVQGPHGQVLQPRRVPRPRVICCRGRCPSDGLWSTRRAHPTDGFGLCVTPPFPYTPACERVLNRDLRYLWESEGYTYI